MNHMTASFSCMYVNHKLYRTRAKGSYQIQLVFVYLRLPFNTKTPLGYLAYVTFNFATTFCVIFSAVPAICFLIGCAWLFICFGKDVKNNLPSLNVGGKLKKRNCVEVKRHFCKIVQTYSDAKELSI